MDRSYPGPAALTLLSLTPPLTPCAGKIVNVLRVSVCLCVRVCVPMSMQVPVCRADRFRKRTLDSFLYCSLPCCFLRQGFSWSLTFAIFLLDWLARIPKISLCLSPVLGLQTYMANLGVFHWRFKLWLSCSKSRCCYLQTRLLSPLEPDLNVATTVVAVPVDWEEPP